VQPGRRRATSRPTEPRRCPAAARGPRASGVAPPAIRDRYPARALRYMYTSVVRTSRCDSVATALKAEHRRADSPAATDRDRAVGVRSGDTLFIRLVAGRPDRADRAPRRVDVDRLPTHHRRPPRVGPESWLVPSCECCDTMPASPQHVQVVPARGRLHPVPVRMPSALRRVHTLERKRFPPDSATHTNTVIMCTYGPATGIL
jgi:hypothetical protein